MLVDYMRLVNAERGLKFSKEFKFLEFDDVTKDVHEKDEIPENLEIWAKIKIPYNGKLPESNRVLNGLIAKWVDQNQQALTKVVHSKLAAFIKKQYSGANTEEIEKAEESVIWDDQSEYMPMVDDKEQAITVELDLVLDVEEMEKKEAADIARDFVKQAMSKD